MLLDHGLGNEKGRDAVSFGYLNVGRPDTSICIPTTMKDFDLIMLVFTGILPEIEENCCGKVDIS